MINLKVLNKNLLVSNLNLLVGQETARLVADIASGSASLTVDNISGFAINDYILIGNFGDPSAEIIKLHATTTPTGSTITLAANTAKDHYADTKITKLDYNQVEFSHATTLTGSKSVLGTVTAISADRTETGYKDLVNSTGYAFARFKNATTSAFSDYSTGVSYSGNDSTSVQDIIEKACQDTLTEVGGEFSSEKALLSDANDAQDAVTDFDWKFELVTDSTLSVVQYDNSVDLAGLTYEMKYPGIVQGVKGLKLNGTPLDYVDNKEMDTYYRGIYETALASEAAIGATSITLADSNEFTDSGTIYVGGFAITYTANDTATGVLSGISASNITSIITAGSVVRQKINPGLPTKYTITADNKIIFNVPIGTKYNGYHITLEYLKKLTRFTDFSSTTEIPFSNLLSLYVEAKIEKRKRNTDEYEKRMADFKDDLTIKLAVYKLPILENSKYYHFFDDNTNSNPNILC